MPVCATISILAGLQAQISTICLTAKTTKFRFIKEPIFNTTAYRCVVVSLWFRYGLNIYDYEDGIAKVRWEVNPDGMYYRDEDGFGKTDDDEQNLFHNRFMEGAFWEI